MKTNRFSWIVVGALAGLLAASPLALAGEQSDAKPRARQGQRAQPARDRAARLAEDLKLTEEQRTKVKEALKQEAGKAKALREDSSLTPEQRREKAKALREDATKKMKEILTADQFEKWQKDRAERAKRNPATQRPPREGRPKKQA